MPTALITGITGQDGGYLSEQLVADGWKVHGILRSSESIPDNLTALKDAITFSRIDLLDMDALALLLAEIDPDEVYNFVGVSSVALSWNEPITTFRVNAEVVATLLELLWRRYEAGRTIRFLQASSAEIFAGANSAPQDENTPISPRTPYGASKAYAHHLVRVYRERGLYATNAILYNHESPRRPARFVTKKIVNAVVSIARGRPTQLALGRLDTRRDWGWAPEYVAGMRLALGHPTPDDWVFATGISSSIEDFVRLAFAHIGISDWSSWVSVSKELTRPGDAGELVGDATRSRTVLGWEPKMQLDKIVGMMVDAGLDSTNLDEHNA